jgi:hypothetical protein
MSLNKTMATLQIGIKPVTVDQDTVQCRYLPFRYSPFSLIQKAGDTTYKKSQENHASS